MVANLLGSHSQYVIYSLDAARNALTSSINDVMWPLSECAQADSYIAMLDLMPNWRM